MAEETTTVTETVTTPAEPEGKGSKEAVLADLAAERDRRQAAEKTARDAHAELERIRASSMTDTEKAVAAAKAEGRMEALQESTVRLAKAEIRASAAGKFANPDLAVRLLDVDQFVTKDGEVDTKGIASEIDKILKQEPYLSAKPGNGSAEGGARGAAPALPLNGDPLEAALRSKLGIS